MPWTLHLMGYSDLPTINSFGYETAETRDGLSQIYASISFFFPPLDGRPGAVFHFAAFRKFKSGLSLPHSRFHAKRRILSCSGDFQ